MADTYEASAIIFVSDKSEDRIDPARAYCLFILTGRLLYLWYKLAWF